MMHVFPSSVYTIPVCLHVIFHLIEEMTLASASRASFDSGSRVSDCLVNAAVLELPGLALDKQNGNGIYYT